MSPNVQENSNHGVFAFNSMAIILNRSIILVKISELRQNITLESPGNRKF